MDVDPLNSPPLEFKAPDGNEGARSSGFGFKAIEHLELGLSEDEFSTSGVRKMILDQLYRLKQENDKLRKIRDRFHTCDKDAAVLRERLKKPRAQDIVHGTALTGGSLLIGVSVSQFSFQPISTIALVVGGVFLAGTVVARLVLK